MVRGEQGQAQEGQEQAGVQAACAGAHVPNLASGQIVHTVQQYAMTGSTAARKQQQFVGLDSFSLKG